MTNDEKQTIARALVPALAAVAALTLGACGRNEAAPPAGDEAVMLTAEDVVLVTAGTVQTGPVLSGSLRPEEQATIRAEVPGSVVETYVEQGDAVRRGQLLARIDDLAITDQLLSAQAGVRTAEQAEELARRDHERARRLAEAGAIAERDLESARAAATAAASRLADARARLALAKKQADNTRITSPIAGVVSEKQVGGGDVVQPGAALFTVVDPGAMRLEGTVSSDQLTHVRVGAPVEFEVRGYPGRAFTGTVERISPVADPVSRQVAVHVAIPNDAGRLVGGLYAQGRVATEVREGLVVPATAVDLSGNTPTAMRLSGGVIERVPVEIGIRDLQAERIEIVGGLAAGDTVLVGAARGVTPGTPARVERLADTAGNR